MVRHAVAAGVYGQHPRHAAGVGITVATEWKRIHAPAWKKIAYTLTFPLFMLTYLPISMAALFMKVEWKPIHHSVNLSSLPYPAAKN